MREKDKCINKKGGESKIEREKKRVGERKAKVQELKGD